MFLDEFNEEEQKVSLFLDPTQCPHIWRPKEKINNEKDLLVKSEPNIDIKCQLCNLVVGGYYYFNKDSVFKNPEEVEKEDFKYTEFCKPDKHGENHDIKKLSLEFMMLHLAKRPGIVGITTSYDKCDKLFYSHIRYGITFPYNDLAMASDESQTMALQKAITKMMEIIN